MNLLVFEAFRILTRNVFPQNLALKQHLRKSDSIKMDCKDARIDASLRVSVGLEPPPP